MPKAHAPQGHTVQAWQRLTSCARKAPLYSQIARIRWSAKTNLAQKGKDYKENRFEARVYCLQAQTTAANQEM